MNQHGAYVQLHGVLVYGERLCALDQAEVLSRLLVVGRGRHDLRSPVRARRRLLVQLLIAGAGGPRVSRSTRS